MDVNDIKVNVIFNVILVDFMFVVGVVAWLLVVALGVGGCVPLFFLSFLGQVGVQ